jgi:hypothetical protein
MNEYFVKMLDGTYALTTSAIGFKKVAKEALKA